MSEQNQAAPQIACTLDAGGAAARVARWRTLARAAQLSRRREPGRVLLTFRRDPAAEAALSELAELERQCCTFLSLEVTPSTDTLVLDVSGPPEAEPVLALFASDPHAAPQAP